MTRPIRRAGRNDHESARFHVVNVAAPSIRAELGGTFASLQWIAAGYTLALTVGLLTGAGMFLMVYPLVQGRELGWPVWTFVMSTPLPGVPATTDS